MTFGLLFCLFLADGVPASAQLNNPPGTLPGESVAGTLRRLADKDLLLQSSSGKVLRFRLLAKTEFRGKDGKPVRDSLMHAGDSVAVYVNPDDIETALYVILLKSGSGSERESASVPVEEARIGAPGPDDFSKVPPENSAPTAGLPALTRGPTANNPAVPALVITRRVDPEYSPEAHAAGLQGTVLLSVDVTPEGTVGNVRIRRGLGLGLDERAVAAVKQWQYKPFIPIVGHSMMDVVEVPFRSDPRGPWRIVGSKLSRFAQLPRVVGPITEPVLSRYISPDAEACTKELDYVPVDLTIGKDGKPADVRVGAAINDRIGKAALDAVRSWKFRPATAGGKPEISSGTILLECRVPGTSGNAGGGIYRLGGGVSAPAVIFRVDPEYSEEARKAKYSGTATLAVVVDAEGRAQDIHVVKVLGMGLDEEAIVAVTQWRFKPGMKDGQPVNERANIDVNFRLQ